MWNFVYFLTGLCIGSFLALCADRLPMGENLMYPHSHCDSCGHRLSALELVPVLGYLSCFGKCHYCGAGIPSKLLIREVQTGFLFLLTGWNKTPGGQLFLLLFFLSCLLLISWMDWDEQMVYDVVLFVLALGSLFHMLYAGSFFQSIWGAVLMGILLSGIYKISHGGMGWGDVKLCSVLGLWLGPVLSLYCLFLASLIGTVVVLVCILMGYRRWREPLPFAPFLCLSAFWLYGWGKNLMMAFTRTLLG